LQFKALVKLELGHKIKAIYCDNASEYKSLGALLLDNYSIQFEYTTIYIPKQNRVSKRLNRSLISVARAILLDAKLPVQFWEEAVITAYYLRNWILIGPNRNTPEKAYSGKHPNIRHLRAYRYIVYIYIPKKTRLKMDNIAIKAYFIGYMPILRQYKLYKPE
jgi:hypothetical protein